MKHHILYMPVETKARELFGKTLLAAKAVERGWVVLFGRQKEIYDAVRFGLPGVFMVNGIPDIRADIYASFRKMGHKIVNLDEENMVYTDGSDYCSRRIGTKALSEISLIFASGERNVQHIKEHRPAAVDKLRLTGNPRFDTLMPKGRVVYESEAANLKVKNGSYLLVNTNFGVVNPFEVGRDKIASLRREGRIANEAHAEYMERWVSYKRRHMAATQALLEVIASAEVFDKIIIRPHPVENHNVWRQWAQPMNIDVQYVGNANEWMLGADAILHTGCTTGIEGLLLDRPVASVVLDNETEFLNCTDEVSVRVANADEFISYVKELRASSSEDLRSRLSLQRSLVRPYMENVSPPLASDRILDALDELDQPEYSVSYAVSHWGVSWRSRRLLADVRSFARKSLTGSRLDEQKFPDLSVNEFKSLVSQWVSVGILNRELTYRRLGRFAWVLS